MYTSSFLETRLKDKVKIKQKSETGKLLLDEREE